MQAQMQVKQPTKSQQTNDEGKLIQETMSQLSKEREALAEMMREMKVREEASRKQIIAEREELERQRKEIREKEESIRQTQMNQVVTPSVIKEGSLRFQKASSNGGAF
jgi:predicted  nucleic acid-binding Zn-ribbon protein